MLQEPDIDGARAALDRDLANALAARLKAPDMAADAEAIALRRLIRAGASHRQAALLKTIWGRLSPAAGSALMVCGPESASLAADRYGVGHRVTAEPQTALLEAERGGRAMIDVAVDRPWWGRLLARPGLSVQAALPDDAHALPRALLVAPGRIGPTGEDRTFWVTDAAGSAGEVSEQLMACGLPGRLLAQGGGLKLFMLAGYVQVEDGRLADAPGSLTGVIGAAPAY